MLGYNELMIFGRPKISGVSVIVPTINSEKYISTLLSVLTKNYQDVIVGIDSKTTDKTREVVAKYKCRIIEINNKFNYVEPILGRFLDSCRFNWIMRLDDDELISNGLVEFTRRDLKKSTSDVIGIHRKWCRLKNGKFEWFNYPQYGFDWQFRLYKKDKVKFDGKIHTPGFEYNNPGFVPVDGYIMHLNWIYQTYEERKAKVEKYERICKGSGHKEFYLYEDIKNFNDYFLPLVDRNLSILKL